MNNEEKAEAAVLAKRAGTQAKRASKNAGRAARIAAEPVIDAVAEEIHETAEKLEETAEDAVRTAKRFDLDALSGMAGEVGMGFFALSVSLWAGSHAVNKFRGAYEARSKVLRK